MTNYQHRSRRFAHFGDDLRNMGLCLSALNGQHLGRESELLGSGGCGLLGTKVLRGQDGANIGRSENLCQRLGACDANSGDGRIILVSLGFFSMAHNEHLCRLSPTCRRLCEYCDDGEDQLQFHQVFSIEVCWRELILERRAIQRYPLCLT